MRTIQNFLCSAFLYLSLYVSGAATLLNPSFESGLLGWVHDVNTYPIGTIAQPIGAEGATVANMGTFDQTGSELRQDIALDKGAYLLRFFLGANSGNDFGRTASVRVVLATGDHPIASKVFSVTSIGYPSFDTGFVHCEMDFNIPSNSVVSIKFLDESANNGVSVDPMLDAIQLVVGSPPAAPSIRIQPVSQTLAVGQSTTLSVVAVGNAPLAYQWVRNGILLPNQTNSFMFLRNMDPRDEGDYWVIVKSIDGQALSSIARITVFDDKNVVSNGSFEAGLVGWNPDAASYEIAAGLDGLKAANLGTFDQPFSAIFQDVPVVAGGRYRLSFASAANAVSVVGAVSHLRVEATSLAGRTLLSETVQDISAGFPNGAVGFTSRDFEFEIPFDVEVCTVSFRDVTPNGGRAVDQMIDAVKLRRLNPDQRSHIFIPSGSGEVENLGSSASFSGPIRFQQIYASGHFPKTPINISEMRFRPDSVLGFPFEGKLDYVKFTLSTSAKTAGQLSLQFEDNLSLDQTVVYEGPWGIFTDFSGPISGPKAADIVLPLQKPFRYDPARGDLVVEIRNYGRLPVRFHTDGFATSGVQRIFSDSSPDAVSAIGGDLSADVIRLAYLPDQILPPTIIQQPEAVTVTAGQDATLSVLATGSGQLGYQWSFEGVPIVGATNQILKLLSVDHTAIGFYSVRINNAFGAAESTQAFLWVQYPPTQFRYGSLQADAGDPISLPIAIKTTGVEGRLAFSIAFAPNRLLFESLELSQEFQGENLILNTNETLHGRLGVELEIRGAMKGVSGSFLLGSVQFRSAPEIAESLVAEVSFSDLPVQQSVTDSKSRKLLASYEPGLVSILFNGFESEASPIGRPDQAVTVTDWVQVGRYVVGLDPVTDTLDFRKADAAPRATRGDGKLTASDWAQAGRYASNSDPLVPVGGPSRIVPTIDSLPDPRPGEQPVQVAVGDPTSTPYGFSVPVLITAVGNEAALTFSLGFDASQFSFRDADLTRYSESWKLLINEKDATLGRIGIGIAPRFGKTFGAGLTNELLRLRFRGVHPLAENTFYFSDSPTPRSLSSSTGAELNVSFGGSYVGQFSGQPVLEYSDQGDSIRLSWRTGGVALLLEGSPSTAAGSQAWTTVSQNSLTIGDRTFVRIEKSAVTGSTFFRLRRP